MGSTNFPKTKAWRAYLGSDCIGTWNFLERCSEKHVLACVRMEMGNKEITVKED